MPKSKHHILQNTFGFNDKMPKCQTQCDNCLSPDVERSDISEQAKMFLSTVYRTDQCFGQGHIVDILLGSNNQQLFATIYTDEVINQ